ncbi:MAG TPA: GrpB family protein [Dehalococcoidia bacterium]|nr:GrpB family protein [Dehalococcoidia bacterium]
MLVEPYNPEWPRWFTQIQAVLHRALAGTYYAIEHVGSTAVPGMTAKPIIDIDVVLRGGAFEDVKRRLEAIGYQHRGDQGVAGREAFRLLEGNLLGALPPHHLYVLEADAEELRRHRAFRDYLISHPEAAQRLSELKWSLAERVHGDRDAYQAGKSALVEEIVAAALEAREART